MLRPGMLSNLNSKADTVSSRHLFSHCSIDIRAGIKQMSTATRGGGEEAFTKIVFDAGSESYLSCGVGRISSLQINSLCPLEAYPISSQSGQELTAGFRS